MCTQSFLADGARGSDPARREIVAVTAVPSEGVRNPQRRPFRSTLVLGKRHADAPPEVTPVGAWEHKHVSRGRAHTKGGMSCGGSEVEEH